MEATASVVPEVRREGRHHLRLHQIPRRTLETEVAVGEVAKAEEVYWAPHVLVAKTELLEHPVQ
jgi:hypothetical protein